MRRRRPSHRHPQVDSASDRLPNGGLNPLSMPLVTYAHGEATSLSWARGWYKIVSLSGSGEIAQSAPLMVLHMTSGIIADMTLRRTPAGGAQFGYADRQRIRMIKQDGTGSIRFVKGASNSFAVRDTRVLADTHDWIEFSYNSEFQRWEEEGFFSDA